MAIVSGEVLGCLSALRSDVDATERCQEFYVSENRISGPFLNTFCHHLDRCLRHSLPPWDMFFQPTFFPACVHASNRNFGQVLKCGLGGIPRSPRLTEGTWPYTTVCTAGFRFWELYYYYPYSSKATRQSRAPPSLYPVAT